MIDFSKISPKSFLGRAVRLPLRLIPREWAVPVVQGPLRGMRWTVGSGIHGCWLGSYEVQKARLFVQELRPGMVVYDIGAHAGFYTLLASPRVGDSGLVTAFEPNPTNLGFLKKHIQINKLRNVSVFEGAVSDRRAEMRFDPSTGSSIGHLSSLGPLKVKAVSLDDWIETESAALPDVIKIDVEGAEKAVLDGAKNLLQTKRPLIFLATHSQQLHVECIEGLRRFGYAIKAINGWEDEIIAVPRGSRDEE